MEIRPAKQSDIQGILEIINHEILHSTSIYDEEERSFTEQKLWFEGKQKADIPIFVAVEADKVLGFSTFGSFRTKIAYRFTVEHSVYIHKDGRGSGAGKALMLPLIESAKQMGLHNMIAGIDSRNEGSIRFHEKLGFVEAGRLHQVGFKFGQWLDLVFMELLL